MKKSFNLITITSFILISVILNIIIFLTIPEGRASEDGFWFVWAFTFPLNLVIMSLGLLYANKKSTDAVTRVPVVLYITTIAFVVYLVGALVFFMYAPNLNFKAAIVFEAIVTALYLIVIMYTLFGLGYIAKNKKNTKDKILFIKLLKADVDSCLAYADEKGATLINALSEKIRFSDPMSHSSLQECEREISALVFNLRMRMKDGEALDLEKEIKKIENLLEYRNERCKILK